jgi:hypothetical protein
MDMARGGTASLPLYVFWLGWMERNEGERQRLRMNAEKKVTRSRPTPLANCNYGFFGQFGGTKKLETHCLFVSMGVNDRMCSTYVLIYIYINMK